MGGVTALQVFHRDGMCKESCTHSGKSAVLNKLGGAILNVL